MADEIKSKNTKGTKNSSKPEAKLHNNMDIDVLTGVGDVMNGDIDVDADEYPDTYEDAIKNEKNAQMRNQ